MEVFVQPLYERVPPCDPVPTVLALCTKTQRVLAHLSAATKQIVSRRLIWRCVRALSGVTPACKEAKKPSKVGSFYAVSLSGFWF